MSIHDLMELEKTISILAIEGKYKEAIDDFTELGYKYIGLGYREKAIKCIDRVIDLYRNLGDYTNAWKCNVILTKTLINDPIGRYRSTGYFVSGLLCLMISDVEDKDLEGKFQEYCKLYPPLEFERRAVFIRSLFDIKTKKEFDDLKEEYDFVCPYPEEYETELDLIREMLA